jgi:hypothetical protein
VNVEAGGGKCADVLRGGTNEAVVVAVAAVVAVLPSTTNEGKGFIPAAEKLLPAEGKVAGIAETLEGAAAIAMEVEEPP